MTTLILASSSRYRAELLGRLSLRFSQYSPNIDESPRPNEQPKDLALRLACEKAKITATSRHDGLIIGSDQTAALDKTLLSKPGDFEAAKAQLSLCSGQTVTFYTGLCLFNAASKQEHLSVSETKVSFVELTCAQIEHYINQEKPFDCAGSFKCEGLGISLFSAIQSNDPTALIGLPLIALTQMLRSEGLDPLLIQPH